MEDDQDIREIFIYLFTSEGYKVNGFASVSAFSESPTSPQLFLLDISLPDGSGLDICRKLKNDPRYATIPILMISAHADRSHIMENCNADDFMEKPFDINVLLSRVEGLINPNA